MTLVGVATAVTVAAPAQADPLTDKDPLGALTNAGIGYNDPGRTEELGQSMCPMLVEPGKEHKVDLLHRLQIRHQPRHGVVLHRHCDIDVLPADDGLDRQRDTPQQPVGTAGNSWPFRNTGNLGHSICFTCLTAVPAPADKLDA